MIAVIAVLLVAVLALIGYLISTRQSGSPALGAKASTPAKAARPPAPADDEDDEATQVRVVGPRLVRIVGKLKVGDEISLAKGITIGRGQNCTLRLNDAELSSTHADIRIENGAAVLLDLGSTNGTYVNEVQVPSNSFVNLKDGDEIRMGTTHFLFKSQK